jgi:hypothetical protein
VLLLPAWLLHVCAATAATSTVWEVLHACEVEAPSGSKHCCCGDCCCGCCCCCRDCGCCTCCCCCGCCCCCCGCCCCGCSLLVMSG